MHPKHDLRALQEKDPLSYFSSGQGLASGLGRIVYFTYSDINTSFRFTHVWLHANLIV